MPTDADAARLRAEQLRERILRDAVSAAQRIRARLAAIEVPDAPGVTDTMHFTDHPRTAPGIAQGGRPT